MSVIEIRVHYLFLTPSAQRGCLFHMLTRCTLTHVISGHPSSLFIVPVFWLLCLSISLSCSLFCSPTLGLWVSVCTISLLQSLSLTHSLWTFSVSLTPCLSLDTLSCTCTLSLSLLSLCVAVSFCLLISLSRPLTGCLPVWLSFFLCIFFPSLGCLTVSLFSPLATSEPFSFYGHCFFHSLSPSRPLSVPLSVYQSDQIFFILSF
ncbi:hypothetical protein AALO_G00217610 [Alosa alosa]|uniref:Uncharacterized protein n=1 Tax=Alosa alosa TaxID=278164 RepID=A0AAV6G4T9_9TELE|nr:hypothetical protein AALO_G00217610 [Alosa alosa]